MTNVLTVKVCHVKCFPMPYPTMFISISRYTFAPFLNNIFSTAFLVLINGLKHTWENSAFVTFAISLMSNNYHVKICDGMQVLNIVNLPVVGFSFTKLLYSQEVVYSPCYFLSSGHKTQKGSTLNLLLFSNVSQL